MLLLLFLAVIMHDILVTLKITAEIIRVSKRPGSDYFSTSQMCTKVIDVIAQVKDDPEVFISSV